MHEGVVVIRRWHDYLGALLDVELELACLSGEVILVALALYCLGSTQPLSCLGSSVAEHLPSKQCVVGSSPT